LLFALAAYAVDLAVAGLRLRTPPVAEARRPGMGAVAGLLVLVALRAVVPFASRQIDALHERTRSQVPDPDGFRSLADWAPGRSALNGAGAFGRLMFQGDSDSNWIDHVAAETGLPVFFLDDSSPDAVGRERIENDSPASLQRFNVRWIAAKG